MTDLDPLDQVGLRSAVVRAEGRWSRLDVVETTGSTNADLAGRARNGDANGHVLVTNFQSAGRGRQGRTWTAPPGTSIALSVCVRPDPDRPPANAWTWLPLLTGLAVVDALEDAAGLTAALKWPNDVLVAGRKLCGILAERVETPNGPACVIGIGLNVHLREDQLPVPTATSVALAGGEPGPARQVLVVALLRRLDEWLARWEAADPMVMTTYRQCCDTLGRSVRVLLAGDQTSEGEAVGIDHDGRLRVRTVEGERVFGAGDIVHLR